jgi:nitrite reductase/ring-hydroxylating ferredoxin subunit
MDLPDPISAIGEQLSGGGAVTPTPEFFEAYEVFGAELSNIFVKPWLAVDHASRLGEDNSYFRLDVGSRSIVLVRETAECMHALRNACLHAGYRICDEEDGKGNHLFCYYHGWDYALDGRLTDPELRPEIEDRSRFRLPRYAMQIRRGLIFVDLSVAGPNPPEPGSIELGAVPEDLGERVVTRRQRCPTTWNWKHLRDFLWQRKELAFPAGECDTAIEFGALSFIAAQGEEAVLVRLVPRFPGHTDIDLVRMAPRGAAPAAGDEDRVAAAVRDAGGAIAAEPLAALSPGFYQWYWSALSAPARN